MSSNIKDRYKRHDLCPAQTENLWHFIDPIHPALNRKPKHERTVVKKHRHNMLDILDSSLSDDQEVIIFIAFDNHFPTRKFNCLARVSVLLKRKSLGPQALTVTRGTRRHPGTQSPSAPRLLMNQGQTEAPGNHGETRMLFRALSQKYPALRTRFTQ